MVNKCSVTRCKSRYEKNNVKVRLHRFPLSNPKVLPAWIAATGREKDWKPCKSSRMCGNHFKKSDYMIDHGKGVLKKKSVPTIEYRTEKYNKRKPLNPSNDERKTNKDLKIKSEDISDTNLEIVSNSENDHDNKVDFNCGETQKNKYKDFNYEIKNEICNRKNQCYMFTNSFKENAEPIVLTPLDDKSSEGKLKMYIDKSIADSKFKKIMALRLKKQRRTRNIYLIYLKTLKKRNFLLKHKS